MYEILPDILSTAERKFIKGTLNKDVSGHVFVQLSGAFCAVSYSTNHRMQVTHWRRVKK